MNYEQFVSAVESKVSARTEKKKEISVCVHTVMKNNGKERRGITVTEQGVNISPTIYLEEYFEQFQDGRTMERIVDEILDLYEQVKIGHSWNGERLCDYREIKDKLACKLIHREKNRRLLLDTPHIRWLDLAVVFYVILDVHVRGTVTMLVKSEHLKLWDVTREELYERARENTELLLPYEFRPMGEVVSEMLAEEDVQMSGEEALFVLSNKQRNFGAACMLYEGMAERIGEELGENYYILPSSIHEVIIVPESKSPMKNELEAMVREINETQVDEEEVLSDRVYYFSRKEKRLLL